MAIAAISGVSGAVTPIKAPTAAADGVQGFAAQLESLVTRVEDTTSDANTAITNMVDQKGDVHEAMIALHRAETALQLTVQVRNKLVQAYQDIMRMPV
jgi:flagellar hook-basal body complex protein FliE